MEEKPASWKKLSAVSQASANPGTMGVKMHRSYHLNDEDETEVDMDDVAKGSPSMMYFWSDYKSNNKINYVPHILSRRSGYFISLITASPRKLAICNH